MKFRSFYCVCHLLTNNNLVVIKAKHYDHLFTNPDPDFSSSSEINPKSLIEYTLLAENSIKNVKVGDTIQLERRGFYIVDCVVPQIVLINIPDGKEKQNHLFN